MLASGCVWPIQDPSELASKHQQPIHPLSVPMCQPLHGLQLRRQSVMFPPLEFQFLLGLEQLTLKRFGNVLHVQDQRLECVPIYEFLQAICAKLRTVQGQRQGSQEFSEFVLLFHFVTSC
jgi:hypothetical protein